MLKWAKPNQRRVSECSDIETSSTLSSDSSESGITVPIRYHERRASRPKSLALSSTDVLDLDQDNSFFERDRRAHRTTSNPSVFAGYNRSSAQRHSMIVSSKDMSKLYNNSTERITHNNNTLHISSTQNESECSGVLKISTTDCDKPKSRNSFWKNLRAKAQGKKSDRKLEKAHSTSNIPELSQQTASVQSHDSKTPTNEIATSGTLSATCPSPIVMRKHQKSLADSVSPSKGKANVMRRRSFKLIKKQNENKKPKPFTKSTDNQSTEDHPITGSPDSGISSIRGMSISTTDSDSDEGSTSPITPINVSGDGSDICLRQQFTSVVLQYLNERLEKKGYETIVDRTSSTSSIQSEDGAPDIFCYDTETVARRPSHRMNTKQRVQPLT